MRISEMYFVGKERLIRSTRSYPKGGEEEKFGKYYCFTPGIGHFISNDLTIQLNI